MTPEKHESIRYELQECSNILYFLTTAIITMLESREELTDSEITGAQTCLFGLKDRLNAAITSEFEGGTAK